MESEHKIQFTETALEQYKLIVENDFTLAGKYFRILISGKGCDGFMYSVGFTNMASEDLTYPIANSPAQEIIMDNFTAFYLKNITIDYIQNFAENQEGFHVINHDQTEFHGKFWLKDPTKIPSTQEV